MSQLRSLQVLIARIGFIRSPGLPCSGSMIPDTHQGGNSAILNEVSDVQK